VRIPSFQLCQKSKMDCLQQLEDTQTAFRQQSRLDNEIEERLASRRVPAIQVAASPAAEV
jgi:hypothetical protein